MTVDDIFRLAQQLYDQLPSTTIALGLQAKALTEETLSYVWCERLEAALREGGIDQLGAVVLGDTLASYLGLAMSTRFGNLDTLYEEALTALNNQAGGFSERWQSHEVWAVHYLRAGDITVAQIACFLDWWLCREDNEATEDHP